MLPDMCQIICFFEYVTMVETRIISRCISSELAPLSSVHLSSLYEGVLVRIFQVFQMPLSMINSFHFAEYEYFFFLVGEFGKTYLLLWSLSLLALPLQEASNMASNRF